MDWMQPALEIVIAALVSSLLLLVEHYAPGGQRTNVVGNYILGVLALILPLSGLMIMWRLWPVVIAIWAIVAAGGLTVMGAYAIDSYRAMVQRVKAAEIENKLLRPEIERHGSND
jgi:4-hydroxybenzoate polyprenyltransferase